MTIQSALYRAKKISRGTVGTFNVGTPTCLRAILLDCKYRAKHSYVKVAPWKLLLAPNRGRNTLLAATDTANLESVNTSLARIKLRGRRRTCNCKAKIMVNFESIMADFFASRYKFILRVNLPIANRRNGLSIYLGVKCLT